MKEYISIRIEKDVETELNIYAKKGWKLVCPSCVKWWFIMERDIKSKEVLEE